MGNRKLKIVTYTRKREFRNALEVLKVFMESITAPSNPIRTQRKKKNFLLSITCVKYFGANYKPFSFFYFSFWFQIRCIFLFSHRPINKKIRPNKFRTNPNPNPTNLFSARCQIFKFNFFCLYCNYYYIKLYLLNYTRTVIYNITLNIENLFLCKNCQLI